MPLIQGQVGVQTQPAGKTPVFRALYSGEAGITEVHAKYQESVLRGNVYSLYQVGVTQATAATFPYAAGGTGLIGLFNPAGSGKNLVMLAAGLTVETPGTAAQPVTLGLTLTSTLVSTSIASTSPTNMLTLLSTGSVAFGTLIAALTSNTIQNSIITVPIVSVGLTTVTTPGPNPMQGFFDLGGIVVVAPGNQLVLGCSAVLTVGKLDTTLIWEEVPAAS